MQSNFINAKCVYYSIFLSTLNLFSKLLIVFKEFKAFGALMIYSIITPGLGALILIATSSMWLESFSQLGLYKYVLFLILSSLLTGASLVPTHATSLIAGILFGAFYGPLCALSSVSVSALLGYAVMGRLIGTRFTDSLFINPKAQKIHHHLLTQKDNKTTFFIILLRLSPIMPFAATNLILASCNTSLKPYLIGSILGLAPRVIIVTLAGVGLKELDLSKSGDQYIAIIGIIATFLAIAYITKIVKSSLQHSAMD